jgi:hypothetical protein
MSNADEHQPKQRHYAQLSVAHIREFPGRDFVEVAFLQSARFYRLLGNHPDYQALLARLREAMTSGHPLKVGTAAQDSNIIESVQST